MLRGQYPGLKSGFTICRNLCSASHGFRSYLWYVDRSRKTEQLGNQPQTVKDACFPILDSLKAGKTVASVNPMFYSLFRPSVQPYMISWFRYDPQVEIQKLSIPIFIIQGANDLQVSTADAHALHRAHAKTQLILIDQMNHVLKIVDGDRNANIKTYSDPSLPIAEKLVSSLVDFIWAH